MKKKWRLKKWVLVVLIFIFVIGIIYSLSNILLWNKNVNENKKINEKIMESIVIEEDVPEEEEKYKVDFETLKEQNPDTVAYLEVNNTNINYVVVKGKDNSYYLNHNFEKKWNIAGWIFADYHNKYDGTDRNLVIYGHNTRDGSMFDTLKDILKRDWQENIDNRKVLLVTENGTYYYEVFSVYSIAPEEYYINTVFSNDEEFYKFMNVVKSRSIYSFNVDLKKEDRILTLSSCLGNGERRVVLHAKLLEE